jgi:hypothetical protein
MPGEMTCHTDGRRGRVDHHQRPVHRCQRAPRRVLEPGLEVHDCHRRADPVDPQVAGDLRHRTVAAGARPQSTELACHEQADTVGVAADVPFGQLAQLEPRTG